MFSTCVCKDTTFIYLSILLRCILSNYEIFAIFYHVKLFISILQDLYIYIENQDYNNYFILHYSFFFTFLKFYDCRIYF